MFVDCLQRKGGLGGGVGGGGEQVPWQIPKCILFYYYTELPKQTTGMIFAAIIFASLNEEGARYQHRLCELYMQRMNACILQLSYCWVLLNYVIYVRWKLSSEVTDLDRNVCPCNLHDLHEVVSIWLWFSYQLRLIQNIIPICFLLDTAVFVVLDYWVIWVQLLLPLKGIIFTQKGQCPVL